MLSGGEKVKGACMTLLNGAMDHLQEFGAEVLAIGKDLPMVGAAFSALLMIANRAQQAKVRGGRDRARQP